MSSAEDESCFTVTWVIENYSLVLKYEKTLSSPAWKTDTIENCAWWRLSSNHSFSRIRFTLLRLTGSTVLDRCQFFLIDSCGEIPLTKCSDLSFYIDRLSIFSDNILTLSCKMWKRTIKAGEYRHHSVLQEVNYSWGIERECRSNYTYLEKNNFLLYIKVHRDEDIHSIILGSVPGRESYVSIEHCKLFINYDYVGHVVSKECIPFVSLRYDIKNFEEKYRGSGLQFQLDCFVAVHKNHFPQFFSSESSLLDSAGILNNDLLHVFKEKTFSDTTLTTEGKSFSAHRSILAARSPVFSAMLKKEQMSEGIVVIEDIDSATLGRMLVFLYSDSLEEMNWEEAMALYYAADKYAIPYLKQKCADVLKAGLALDNACQALILADMHSDQDLMKCAIDFIRDHRAVFSSGDWEDLEENHSKLAAKSLRVVFVKK